MFEQEANVLRKNCGTTRKSTAVCQPNDRSQTERGCHPIREPHLLCTPAGTIYAGLWEDTPIFKRNAQASFEPTGRRHIP